MKRKLYITLLGLLSTIMTAAVPYCDVRKFSITDGLAANTISDLKQGKDNLMWFSTWNGLSFYDGYKFHTFRDNPDDIDVLSTNRILKIEPSYNNSVWCITYDHQLYVYDTHLLPVLCCRTEIQRTVQHRPAREPGIPIEKRSYMVYFRRWKIHHPINRQNL